MSYKGHSLGKSYPTAFQCIPLPQPIVSDSIDLKCVNAYGYMYVYVCVYFIYLRRKRSVGWDCRKHWLHFSREPRLPQRVSCGRVGCGCRIHRLHLFIELRPPHTSNDCHDFDTFQSDSEAPVILELWGIWSIPSLPSQPNPLWPGVIPFRAPFIDQIDLF